MFANHLQSLLEILGVEPRKPQHQQETKKPIDLSLDVLEDRTVPSTITGHAYTDLTGNGFSADDTGKQGVVIRLYKDSHQNGRHDGRDRLIAKVFTGADGSYSFGNLSAGRYFVEEKTPGGFIQTAPANDSYTIQLGNNQTVTGKDFDYFRRPVRGEINTIRYQVTHGGVTQTFRELWNHVDSSDTVTVSFTVARNSPPVQLSLASYNSNSPRFNEGTLSQDTVHESQTGTFGPGTHTMTVQVPNGYFKIYFVRGAVIDHFGPASGNASYHDQHRVIGIDYGGTEEPPPPPPPPVVAGTLSGHVFDDANRDFLINAGDGGLSGVVIQLTGTDYLGQSVSLSTITDADGDYVFANLLPGTYAISQTVPNGLTGVADFVGTLGGNPASATLIDQIVVESGQIGANYDFLNQQPVPPPEQGSSISGNVTLQDGVGGPFVAAAGITVQLLDSDDNPIASVTTDSEGNYTFNNVLSGPGISYTIRFVNPNTSLYQSAPMLSVDMFTANLVVTGMDGVFNARETT